MDNYTQQPQEKRSPKFLIIILILIGILVAGYFVSAKFVYNWWPFVDSLACTQDAKQCPDGSYVGRTGPNCEFVCPAAE